MKILIACEYSATVREAFRLAGHDAMSCDLLPTEIPGNHYQGDVFDIIENGWDMMIAHPPCTHLSVSGARWFKDKLAEQTDALQFVASLMETSIPKVAIENQISSNGTTRRANCDSHCRGSSPWESFFSVVE